MNLYLPSVSFCFPIIGWADGLAGYKYLLFNLLCKTLLLYDKNFHVSCFYIQGLLNQATDSSYFQKSIFTFDVTAIESGFKSILKLVILMNSGRGNVINW